MLLILRVMSMGRRFAMQNVGDIFIVLLQWLGLLFSATRGIRFGTSAVLLRVFTRRSVKKRIRRLKTGSRIFRFAR